MITVMSLSRRLYLVNNTQLLTSEIQAHLNTNADGSCGNTSVHCVTLHEYSTTLAALELLAADVTVTRIWIASSSNYAMFKAAGVRMKPPVSKSNKHVVNSLME